MRLSVVGTGHVGLVTGACLAEMGNQVLCVDNDETKIRGLHAQGSEELVRVNEIQPGNAVQLVSRFEHAGETMGYYELRHFKNFRKVDTDDGQAAER